MSKIKEVNLKKKDISKKIILKTGLSYLYTSQIIDDFINTLKDTIKYKEINIKNFGKFKIISKNERIGRNPRNKKIYKIKARRTLSYTASKKLNDKINDI
tara:strand:- start:4843 stop:5142 length:300 start_codon:yes stop_codon:yes gene_type:complete